MKKITILLLVLSVQFVRAEIPLELVEEIQLPTNSGVWDVAHWESEESYGWAAGSHDSVFYSYTEQDSVRTFVIPESWGYFDGIDTNFIVEHLTLLRSVAVGQSEFQIACVTFHNFWATHLLYQLGYISLSDSSITMLRDYDPYSCNSESGAPIGVSGNVSIWPPLPAPSEFYYFSGTMEVTCNGYYDDWNDVHYDGYDLEHGHAFIFRVMPTWNMLMSLESVHRIAQFSYESSLHAGWNTHKDRIRYHDLSSYIYSLTSVGNIENLSISSSETLCVHPESTDSLPVCRHTNYLVSQCDLDGDRRIIVRDMNTEDQTRCFDGYTMEQLWGNPEVIPDFSVRVPDRDDEVILQIEGNHFIVYEAENGQVINTTTEFLGEPKKVLKKLDGASEIVTHENGLLRIYRFLPHEFELTINYSAEENVLMLNWDGFEWDVSYDVYRSASADAEIEEMEFVATTDTNYFEVTPMGNREFFRVRGEW